MLPDHTESLVMQGHAPCSSLLCTLKSALLPLCNMQTIKRHGVLQVGGCNGSLSLKSRWDSLTEEGSVSQLADLPKSAVQSWLAHSWTEVALHL